jgi:hypothetical protein
MLRFSIGELSMAKPGAYVIPRKPTGEASLPVSKNGTSQAKTLQKHFVINA